MSEIKRPDIIRHTVSSSGESFVKDKDIRGNQIDTSDILTSFSIGLVDIDSAIMSHIKDVILPQVFTGTHTVAPPVVYASPEIWQSIQKNGVYRDTAGKVIYPVIVVARDNMELLTNTTSKLDANTPLSYYTYKTTYSKANQYSQFDQLNNRTQVAEYRSIVIPDYVRISYTIYVFTDYVEHNNKIIEVLGYASNSFWGAGTTRYKAQIESIPTTIENTSETGGRVVTSQFTLNVFGSLLPDAIIRHANSTQKYYGKSVLSINISEEE